MSVVADIDVEADNVKKFRQILYEKDLLPSSQDNYGTFLRFLKLTKSDDFDLDESVRRWEKMVKWRRENKVDTILQDFVYEEREAVDSCFFQGFHGVDKEGRPVLIDRIAKRDFSKLMRITTPERFLWYCVQEIERSFVDMFPACSENANKRIDSIVQILDLQGLDRNYKGHHEFATEFCRSIGKIYVEHYPNTTYRIIAVNCGLLERLLLGLAKLTCFRNSRAKFHFYGRNYKKKLLEFIDESQLPEFLGGSCSCPGVGGCLTSDRGPWNKPVETGPSNKARKPAERGPSNKVNKPAQDANAKKDPCIMHETRHTTYSTDLDDKLNALSHQLDAIQTTLSQIKSIHASHKELN